jgi:hypothetical protein
MQIARTSFDSIRPGDIDIFAFDLGNEIGDAASITNATWACAVSATSKGADPTPEQRLIGSPAYDRTKTQHQAGGMLAGVVYTLSIVAQISDGRTLSADGDVECALEPAGGIKPREPAFAKWDFVEFTTFFPEFNNIDPDTACSWWNVATGLHRNDGSGPVQDVTTQGYLLYLLTAHIGARSPGGPGGAAGGGIPSFIVGSITSASQGPISVGSTPLQGGGAMGQWYNTTPFGAQYWALTQSYRLFRYRPGRRRVFDVYAPPWRRLGM